MARKEKEPKAEEQIPLSNPELIRDEFLAQTLHIFDLELDLEAAVGPIKAKMKKAKKRQKELARELRKSGAVKLADMLVEDDDEGGEEPHN